MEALADYRSEIEPTLSIEVDGTCSYSRGRWSQGPTLRQMLGTVGGMGLPALGDNSAAYIQVTAEAMKPWFSDRPHHVRHADPAGHRSPALCDPLLPTGLRAASLPAGSGRTGGADLPPAPPRQAGPEMGCKPQASCIFALGGMDEERNDPASCAPKMPSSSRARKGEVWPVNSAPMNGIGLRAQIARPAPSQ